MEELCVILMAVASRDAASLGSPPHDVAQALDNLNEAGARLGIVKLRLVFQRWGKAG